MRPNVTLTRHARDRSTERAVPPGIIELITAYGESRRVRDDADSYALTGDSMAAVRRDYGRGVASALEPYRKRGAYVVSAKNRVVTVAFAGRPMQR